MKRFFAAASAALIAALVATSIAAAAPADVTVRIEGKAGTIFDRVVRTDGHTIQASSDIQARTCDGTNLGANPEPGPTPTAASVDAMSIIGETFDGQWYDGYDDYFIQRWGPDAEDNDNAWWWGILVNRDFTPVGGCQFRVTDGDEVLWIFDAFNGRPMLGLDGPATAVVGEPTEVTVTSFTDSSNESPYAGATVSGLTAAVAPVPSTITVPGTSGGDGKATVTFKQPGWKRLKAYDVGTGAIPTAVPSNAIDVCVEREAGSGCAGEAPSQIPAVVGEDPAVEPEEPEPTCETDPSLCPEPEPTCETDPSLCPEPEPTCETDPSLCPKPAGSAEVRIGGVDPGKRRVRWRGSAKVKLTVRNDGDAASAAVTACLRSGRLKVKRPCRGLGSLEPGEKRTITFTVRNAKARKIGTRLPVRITVAESGGTKLTRTLKLGVSRR